MIDSFYWKEELRRIAVTVQRVAKPRRWSERAHCTVERDLTVGFFLLRRLIELNLVSSAIKSKRIRVFSFRALGKRVTRINAHRIGELYDCENEVAESKSPLYVSNQFIHAYTSMVARDQTRNWSDVIVVSDFDRNDCIWRIPVCEIEILFKAASVDYPHTVEMKFNPKSGDYDVKTN
jgi:hypothetical protein